MSAYSEHQSTSFKFLNKSGAQCYTLYLVHYTNIAVFSEKTDVPHLPNQSMVAISVMKLWPWKLGQGHQNLISYDPVRFI